MHAPTLTDTTVMLAPTVDTATATAEAVRRTWLVTADVYTRVLTGVASTYEAWGVAWPVADLLGEMAADFTDEVLKLHRSPYVAVTAMIEGRRATVSVIPANLPEPPRGFPLPARPGNYVAPSGGLVDLTTGPCRWAGINLLSVHPRETAR